MKPTDIVNFERIIGKPRLQSYRSYFKTNSPEATTGLYMWNGEISNCFAALLSYFEICLRNSIHIAMANHYLGNLGSGAHWWDVIATQLGNRAMKKIVSFLFEMNDFRNRLAHHEPLWKFGAIKDTSTIPATLLVEASTDLASTRARFARLLRIYDDAMSFISVSLYRDLLGSSWRKRLDFLLSDRGFDRYAKARYAISDVVATPYHLHRNFSTLVKRNEPIPVRRAQSAGIFIPD